MKNKWIGIIISVVAIGVVVLLVMDGLKNRTGKRGSNPYELKTDQYLDVDPELIIAKEIRQIKLGESSYHGIAIQSDKLFVLGDSLVRIITIEGAPVKEFRLPETPGCIHVSGETIYVGFSDHLSQYYIDGRLIKQWDSPGERTQITSIAVKEDFVFVADAGNRRVIKYDRHGQLLDTFEGKRSESDLHGFVIPSGYFDLAVYLDELWVVNPGMHALENYSDEGILRGYWEAPGMKIDELSGCCNPAQMTIDADGNFITSEKGLVRIKKYKASGEFIGVIAEPKKFATRGLLAPEVIVTDNNQVVALDFDQKMIRFFEYK